MSAASFALARVRTLDRGGTEINFAKSFHFANTCLGRLHSNNFVYWTCQGIILLLEEKDILVLILHLTHRIHSLFVTTSIKINRILKINLSQFPGIKNSRSLINCFLSSFVLSPSISFLYFTISLAPACNWGFHLFFTTLRNSIYLIVSLVCISATEKYGFKFSYNPHRKI